MTKKQLEELYDSLYERGTALFKEYNPCQIETDSSGKTTCIRFRHRIRSTWVNNFCCGGCKYVGPKGCRVKSLSCKLWICEHIVPIVPNEFLEELNELKRESHLFVNNAFRLPKYQLLQKASKYLLNIGK